MGDAMRAQFSGESGLWADWAASQDDAERATELARDRGVRSGGLLVVSSAILAGAMLAGVVSMSLAL
jgi:hypothetical protein